jgi:hypothetical protein
MRIFLRIMTASFFAGFAIAFFAADETQPPIDVERGGQLMRKFQAGETLTSEEQAYLDRVHAEIRKRTAGFRHVFDRVIVFFSSSCGR